MAKVAVVGGGYVGLVTAAGLAHLKHDVVCIEIDPSRLQRLQSGDVPIFEPGLDELVREECESGRLQFSGRYDAAIPASDVAFIAVNTPEGGDGQPDTRFLLAAVDSVLAHARDGLMLAIKSTAPVGTGDAVAGMAAAAGKRVLVASNPEFLREGCALADFFNPDRIVVGAAEVEAGAAVAQLFASLPARVIHCTRRSAELAKYASNAVLAARISLMNEIAGICDKSGADIEEVTHIVGADARIGPSYLRAGLGWGGSCFPKDVRALAAAARALGRSPLILDAVWEVNSRQQEHSVGLITSHVERDACVAVLGLAFKPRTDDIRSAPALHVIRRLLEAGYRVKAHDPVAMANARALLPEVAYCDDPYEAAADASALLLATEWPEYLCLEWARVRALMYGRLVVDGRNALDPAPIHEAGLTYLAFGRRVNGHVAGPTVPMPTPSFSGNGNHQGEAIP